MKQILKQAMKKMFGCRCCYHYSTMSQFGGPAEGRRARGFYATYKVRCCGKHTRRAKDNPNFGVCDDFDFCILAGAGFEGYYSEKSKEMPWWELQKRGLRDDEWRVRDHNDGIIEEPPCRSRDSH